MSFNFVKKLPTPAEIREQYPVSDAIIQVKKERDEMTGTRSGEGF